VVALEYGSASDGQRSRVSCIKSGDQSQSGGLATTAGTQQSNYMTFRDAKREINQRLGIAKRFREALAH